MSGHDYAIADSGTEVQLWLEEDILINVDERA
jgi:hypothetical protein